MVDGVELAKSDKSNCRFCKKQIGKGVPRGYIIDERHQGGHINLCYKCSFENIDDKIMWLNKAKKELKKLIKKNQKAIVLQEL